jgi:hypothetical protein
MRQMLYQGRFVSVERTLETYYDSFMELQDCQMLVTSVDGKARCYDIRKGLCTVDSFSSSLLR